jgi:Mrp family chromosome partitioning ATPase
LRHPALGDLPLIEGETLPPGVSDVAFIERCYVLARQVRHESPDRAARVLVTSASRGEGRTTVALNLAACWGRERQRVLVIDAHVRQDEQQEALRSIITEDERPALGIEAYLAELTSDAASLVCPSVLPGVSVLPCFEALSHPSLLWSPRMEALLDAITPGFDVVVIDAPPLLPNVDTASVARWTDAVILVVRSQGVPMATLHEAVKRLDACGVTLTGAVLNAVRAPFREGR